MPKIKEFTLAWSEVVPTGEYKNARPFMSITFAVDEADVNMDEVFVKSEAELKDRFYAWLPTVIRKAEYEDSKRDIKKNLKTISAQCEVKDCILKTFYPNEKNGRTWYSHKGRDGQYHNLT